MLCNSQFKIYRVVTSAIVCNIVTVGVSHLFEYVQNTAIPCFQLPLVEDPTVLANKYDVAELTETILANVLGQC